MINRFCILLVLFLSACGGGGGSSAVIPISAKQPVASEYYPFTTGAALYTEGPIVSARWNGITIVDVISNIVWGPLLVEHSMYSGCAGAGAGYLSAFHDTTARGQPTNWKNALVDGYATVNGIPVIAEIYQQNGHSNPDGTNPEVIITVAPVVGEVIDATARLYTDCSNSAVAGYEHYIYRTVAISADGEYVEVSLYEVDTGTVYRYRYKRHCGLVELVWGPLHADGSVTGNVATFECTK